MPGPLGISEAAILGSTLAWTRHVHEFSGRITWYTPAGHRIQSDGDNPRYWTASCLGKHLGAGAGEFGLAKCVRLCEGHAEVHGGPQKQVPAVEPAVSLQRQQELL